jgi:antirestriction protein ArdC
MEELRSELSSAFLAGELGIPADISNHASDIQNWLNLLKDSEHEIFGAAADAQKIVDMVLGFHPEFRNSHEPNPETPKRTRADLKLPARLEA